LALVFPHLRLHLLYMYFIVLAVALLQEHTVETAHHFSGFPTRTCSRFVW
jgi:hypothetical protein